MSTTNNSFKLTVDNTAPRDCKIEFTAAVIKANGAYVECTATGASYMKIWYATTTTSTEPADATVPWITYTAEAQTTTFSVSDNNTRYYYFAVFKDDLGNKSAVISTNANTTNKSILLDLTNPTGSLNITGSILDGDTTTTSTVFARTTTIDYSCTFADNETNSSGVSRIDFTGDITPASIIDTSVINTGQSSGTLTLTGNDGVKTVTMTVTDASGRTASYSKTIKLDRVLTATSLVLSKIVADGGGVIGTTTDSTPTNTTDADSVTPGYTNKIDFVATIIASTAFANITKYKIWGINGVTTEPQAWTDVPSGTTNTFNVTKQFSTTNELKIINVKIQDEAGNIDAMLAKTTYDSTKPEITSLTVSAVYSNYVNAASSATVTPAINANVSGLASYAYGFKSGESGATKNSNYKTGTGSTVPACIIPASDLKPGTNTVYLIVTDNAGNVSTESSTTIIKDVTGPTFTTIPTLLDWYSENGTLANGNSTAPRDETFVVADASSGLQAIYVWVDKLTTNTRPTNATKKDLNGASATTQVTPYIVTPLNQSTTSGANNYMHAELIDNVNNSTFMPPIVFKYDSTTPTTTAPQIIVTSDLAANTNLSTTAIVGKSSTTSNSVSLTFNAEDANSGISKMNITGTGVKDPVGWQTYTQATTINVTDGEGLKQIIVEFMDVAGNRTTTYSKQIEIDASTPTISGQFYTKSLTDSSYSVPAYGTVKNQEFKVKLTISNEDLLGGASVLIYGDCALTANGAALTETASWTPVSNSVIYIGSTGATTPAVKVNTAIANVSPLFLTTGNGSKTINIKLKDNANHISNITSLTYTLDTSIPEVAISGIGYTTISDVHEKRHLTAVTFDPTYYDDETYFTITPNEPIQAYKIVAYASVAAAIGGSASDTAIPMNSAVGNPSVHMSGTVTTNQSAAISCKLIYDDLKTALGGTVDDGIKVIVAYVQDLSGQWSAAPTTVAG